MSVLWALEPATAAKHRLYKRYLDAWWPIMLQPSPYDGRLRPRVTYLDAFAGPGRYEGGEEGSPVFAVGRLLHHDAAERMHLSRERVRLLFMEKHRSRYQYLQAELDRKFGPLDALPVWPEAFPPRRAGMLKVCWRRPAPGAIRFWRSSTAGGTSTSRCA